jgi:hypothetical protein
LDIGGLDHRFLVQPYCPSSSFAPRGIETIHHTTPNFLGVPLVEIKDEFIAERLQLQNKLKAMRRNLQVINGIYGTGIDTLDGRMGLGTCKDCERKKRASWWLNKKLADDHDWLIEQRTSLMIFESGHQPTQSNFSFAIIIYQSIPNHSRDLQK